MTPESYVAAIRNKAKKQYATALLRYYRGEGPKPSDKSLGFMGRQAVRMNLVDLIAPRVSP